MFQHLFTDGKTIFATSHGLHVVPDAYPLSVKIRSNATFGYFEDLHDENEEEDQPFDAKALVGVVTESLTDKDREIQMYLVYHRDSDAQQVGAECYTAQTEEKRKKTTRLVEDDRRTNAADARVREPAGGFARRVYLPHTTGQSTSWSK